MGVPPLLVESGVGVRDVLIVQCATDDALFAANCVFALWTRAAVFYLDPRVASSNLN